MWLGVNNILRRKSHILQKGSSLTFALDGIGLDVEIFARNVQHE